jgi:hypothetical protein
MSNLANSGTFVGQVTGTATATTVVLGFTPSYVSTENETSGTGYETFGSGKSKKVVSAGTKTFETSATTGLVIISGGFTVVSSASDVINYRAVR